MVKHTLAIISATSISLTLFACVDDDREPVMPGEYGGNIVIQQSVPDDLKSAYMVKSADEPGVVWSC